MSISAMHKFFNKKLIASFAMIDPFGLQKYDGYTVGTNFNIISHSESNTQNFRLSLSYQFNKTILKSKLADKEKQSAINSLKP
jgi:hypothetical protein